MDNPLTLIVDQKGSIMYRDSDMLIPLRKKLGPARITRAASVEPRDEEWWVNLSASGGPLLGPFEARCDAIAAEQEWLDRYLLGDEPLPEPEPEPEPEEAATDMLWEGCPNA